MSRRRRALWMSGVVLLLASCGSGASINGEADELSRRPVDEVITVSSAAFADGAPIPVEHTCDGEDVSPPLSWEETPGDAVELAVVLDDPDAGTFVHWVVWGLDPSTTALDRDALPAGAREAENDDGNVGYYGPCPPEGDDPHTYRFTVYALDGKTDADNGTGMADVLADLQETAIAKGTLTGTFDR